MATSRCTFFFQSTRGYGWTETLFLNTGDLVVAMNAAKTLLPKRVACLGRGSSLTFIRTSDDDIKRDSNIYAVPVSDQTPKTRSIDTADIANTAILVRLETLNFTKRRSLFMRGIPDQIVSDNGEFTPTPEWTANFAQWIATVFLQRFAIKIRGDVAPPVNITNVSTVGPTGLVTITTAAPHGFAQNDVANIRGVLGATQVRGLQKVNSVVDANNFVIRVNRVVKPYLGAGNVCKNAFSLVNIQDGKVVRVTHHNAGRPFDSPRGRRSVR